ncbi:hypothetical protein HAX54_051353 [Datura stramonium]|uniref:Uncharacterized protein n=1 Tax=Datura stramonium TaxID=4076 RepID=A0ABS8SYH4_DATST|nr:hypothetical protein [Datura stramonium]
MEKGKNSGVNCISSNLNDEQTEQNTQINEAARQEGQTQIVYLDAISEEAAENQTKNHHLRNHYEYHIDPREVQNNYLKLISGTSLEEDNDSDGVCTGLNSHQPESSDDNDGDEEESSEDYDYED